MSTINRDPERWEELVADHALVGLSADERDELASLVDDDVFRAEAPLFDRAAGELAAAAFAAQDEREGMPSMLQSAVVRELGRRTATAPIGTRRVAWRERLPWLLAAAAIVLAVAGWARRPEAPPDLSTTRGKLLATAGTVTTAFTRTTDPASMNATGDVVWHAGLQRGFMRIEGLAPNDPKQSQYQLWIFDAERGDTYPVDGGVFDITTDGHGEVVVPIAAKLNVGKAKLFAITVEQPGGVVVSKRERIVLTASPS